MQFKVGDRVKIKEKAMSGFTPNVISQMKEGGTVISINKLKEFPLVKFVNKVKYSIWHNDLELKLIKNQQLLFEFMEQN
jgi:hypothetical protein